MRPILLAIALLLVGARALAAPVDISAAAGSSSQPENLLPVVGVWTLQPDAAGTAVVLDGSKWREGTAAPALTESAASAFPAEAKTFADAVRRRASFPLAIIKAVPTFEAGTVTVRFKPVAGREDQAAGIAFAIQPNGDYLILRANGLENNLILFEFKNGRRTPVKEVRAPAPKTGEWHELKMVVERGTVRGSVDGKQYLEIALKQPTAGRLGLWSKADSVVQFRDLDVQNAP
jgi:hypothetical protein